MDNKGRWLDRPTLRPIPRVTYEHHHTALLLTVFDYCQDSMTTAFRFLKVEDADPPSPTTQSSSSVAHYDDRSIAWVATHCEELYRDYPDEWILVEGESVIAHSADPFEVQNAAQERGITTGLMTKVTRPSTPQRMIYAQQVD